MTTDEQKFLVGIRQIVAAWVERIGIWVIEPKGILQILTETGLEMKTNSPYSFIHSFMIFLQVHYYSEALPTTARILCWSFTPKRPGNCK